jgi:hypothetical protein
VFHSSNLKPFSSSLFLVIPVVFFPSYPILGLYSLLMSHHQFQFFCILSVFLKLYVPAAGDKSLKLIPVEWGPTCMHYCERKVMATEQPSQAIHWTNPALLALLAHFPSVTYTDTISLSLDQEWHLRHMMPVCQPWPSVPLQLVSLYSGM